MRPRVAHITCHFHGASDTHSAVQKHCPTHSSGNIGISVPRRKKILSQAHAVDTNLCALFRIDAKLATNVNYFNNLTFFSAISGNWFSILLSVLVSWARASVATSDSWLMVYFACMCINAIIMNLQRHITAIICINQLVSAGIFYCLHLQGLNWSFCTFFIHMLWPQAILYAGIMLTALFYKNVCNIGNNTCRR